MDTIKWIEDNKIIVIMRGLTKDEALNAADAMYKGGIRLIEVTFPKGGNPKETGETISALCERFDGKVCIGAGTVVTEEQLAEAKEAGAKYIISPNTDTDIIRKTKELGLVSIPGALTPSEVVIADKAGADFVKIFPVSAFGKNYIKQISAPLSDVKLLAVGGVSAENMTDYLAQGAVGVGIGGNVVNKKLIECGDFESVTKAALSYTEQL